MASFDTTLPAYDTWKVLYENIIPTLFNKQSSHDMLMKSWEVIKSKQFLDVFLYTHNSDKPFEEYIKISQYYKGFTVWLLARFYYLFHYEHLVSAHRVVVDVHWYILDQIHRRQPHIYEEICVEYLSALNQVFECYKILSVKKTTNRYPYTIKIFTLCDGIKFNRELNLAGLIMGIPSIQVCSNILKQTVILIHKIVDLNITMGRFNTMTYESLEYFLKILREGNFDLKCMVLEIYVDLLRRFKFHKLTMPRSYIINFHHVMKSVNCWIRHIYVKKRKAEQNREKLENILISLFCNCENLEESESKLKIMTNFLITKDISGNLRSICLQKALPVEERYVLNFSRLVNCHLQEMVELGIFTFMDSLKEEILNEILQYINVHKPNKSFSVVDTKASLAWITVHEKFSAAPLFLCLEDRCTLINTLRFMDKLLDIMIYVNIEVQNYCISNDLEFLQCFFFTELPILILVLRIINTHMYFCHAKSGTDSANELFLKIFSKLPINYSVTCISFVFNCIAYPFYRTDRWIRETTLKVNKDFYEKSTTFCHNWKQLQFSDKMASVYLHSLMNYISVGLIRINPNTTEFRNLQILYTRLVKNEIPKETMYENFLAFPTIFNNRDRWVEDILLPALEQKHFTPTMKAMAMSELKALICFSSSQFVQLVYMDRKDQDLSYKNYCLSCLEYFDPNEDEKNILVKVVERMPKTLTTLGTVFKLQQPINGNPSVLIGIMENVFELCHSSHVIIRKEIANSIHSFSHLPAFHTKKAMLTWIRLLNDDDTAIQRKIVSQIHRILKRQKVLTEKQEELWEILFFYLEIYAKHSLKIRDQFSQESILIALENIAFMKMEDIVVFVINLLFYFIVVTTSCFHLKATTIFIKTAKAYETKFSVYYIYKIEFTETIAQLCAVNHSLGEHSIVTSLDRLTGLLGYQSTKNYITHDCRYLLPVLMSLFMKSPELEVFIKEVAEICETDLSGLLISKYANIYLHIFLNENNATYRKCISYIEKHTQLDELTLAKGNFQTILHELLLNFHNQQTKVLTAIQNIVQTDFNFSTFQAMPDYLQPKFLGILSYFDMKLLGRYTAKNRVLLSLTDLIYYMGPTHITPLRFKILAMLTTVLSLTYHTFPLLNCNIWITFIKTCQIKALGPQLASIFVALAPVADLNPDETFQIFKYLVIDNELKLQDHICDLFFIVESNINYEICIVVRKYLQKIEDLPFKDQLKFFFKYLKHETIDVRIHALKYIKKMFIRNRPELHQLTFGVNGVDPLILQFVDIIMHNSCKETDNSLKLACGECIGELGAIEPTKLPQRRKEGEDNSFVFFISEDGFIINVLNELTRALQSEKNTQIMDRFALAIQEILKVNGISPNVTSPKHILWKNFLEPQRELMLPLLSSRYTMALSVDDLDVPVIYGSPNGLSFKSWIYHWTVRLVLTVTEDKRKLLKVCLPSFKQDYRTLMQFLPYILVHALLEGSENSRDLILTEVKSIISSAYIKSESKILEDLPEESEEDTLRNRVIIRDGTIEHECGKVILVLLDFLDRWVREWKCRYSDSLHKNTQYEVIEGFLKKFSKIKLSHCNFLMGEFSRALMQLEEYLKSKPKEELPNQFSYLVKLYTQMNNADGVAGVIALQSTEPPLEQRLLSYLLSGKLVDATACYEQDSSQLRPSYIKGLVRCYLDMENTNTALHLSEGVVEKQPQLKPILLETQVEPLWRLSRYDDLTNVLQQPELATNNSWDIQIGRALVHFRKEERNEFNSIIDSLRLMQISSLGSTSLQEGIYDQGYSCVAKLHIITELQQAEEMMHELLMRPNDPNVCTNVINNLVSEWNFRLKLVEESVRIQEPILCLRRVAIQQARDRLTGRVPHALPLLNKLLGESWLLSASIARTSGMQQQAYTFTLKAEEYNPPYLFLEKAKLQWCREEHEQALTTLRRGLEVLIPENGNKTATIANLSKQNKTLAAHARLLVASYNDGISNVDTETNIIHYKEAVEVDKEWERGLVCLSQYYDRIFRTLSDQDKDTKGCDIQIHMLNYFGKSLLYGNKYVYQSMPRLLTIWFDCGTRLLEIPPKDNRNSTLLKLTKLVDMYLERLPIYVFFTAFSQLVSRICHPQKQVYIELKAIIIKLILKYPQQSLWNIMSVIKSGYSIRNKRCSEILNDSRLKTSTMIKLVSNFTILADKLIDLCNKEIPCNIQHTTVNSLLKSLPRLLSREDFSQIMVPIEKNRKLVLPNPDFPTTSEHNPFPNKFVYIRGIENEVVVLNSLQRPRKITFLGSDGKRYVQMLKPKDDLRKDFRLMEFNDIVNQMFSWEPDSRQRCLYIRLYSVVPLNEECGLVEWIPNLVGLRTILVNLYEQIGLGMRGRDLKQYCPNLRDSLARKRDIFLNSLMPKHPPVLSDWFRKTFPDAQSWVIARDSYVRTTAVMSMVGYILGLGDRHGENILLDSTTGDAVHVDFNCLFNKGETFECPERVPFRLTHNMVAAMGPLGVEGKFRKSCVATLRVLRTHSTTLMSFITPFVYDPLVSWHRNTSSAQQAQTSERTNEQAVEHVRDIEQRLQGIVRIKGKPSIPLSVEGQTNHIIQESISIDNLCQMYIGWAPYL